MTNGDLPRYRHILVITTIDFDKVPNQRVHHLINYWANHADQLDVVYTRYLNLRDQHTDRPRAANIRYLPVPFNSHNELFDDHVRSHRMATVAGSYDLCFAEGPWAGAVGRLLLERGQVRFLVYEDLDYFPAFFPPTMAPEVAALENGAILAAHLVFCVSRELVRRRAAELSIKAYHSPNGVPFAAFAGQRRPRHRPTAIYAGALDRWSGIDTVIRSWRRVRRRHRRARLVVVGGGPHLRRLRRLARRYRVSRSVVFRGHVPYSQLPRYLARADIGIATLRPGELATCAFPLKFLEYMAAGLPTVCCNQGDMAAIAQITETGLAVRFRYSSIAGAIGRLLRRRSQQRVMGKRAQRLAWFYDWTNIFDQQLHIIAGARG